MISSAYAQEAKTRPGFQWPGSSPFATMCPKPQHIEIQTLANALAVLLRSPVADHSGLTGYRDFTLSWERDDRYSAVPDALAKFGLRLEMEKTPTEVLVIDHVERPSEH